MFQYENIVKGKINVEKVWELYSNVNRWSEWDSDMQTVELEGEFVVGANGTMFMKGMPPLPFTLSEVQKDKAFVNSSKLGDITVTFGHFISEDKNGEAILKHTVIIDGEDEAKLQGIGQGIVANISDHMGKLLELVRTE